LEELIGRMPDGAWELCCHPGYNDAALDAVRTKLRQSRVTELQALTSPAIGEILTRAGVGLQSFRHLHSVVQTETH
ncbi:MAG TPA: ChbG/HpnK family deacetylase, partial [Terriglobales bacterium]